MKKLLFLICILFINLVSAAGLTIQGQRDFYLNKTIGTNKTIEISILNEENYHMYNLTTDNLDITMPKTNLLSGEIKNITLIIKKDSNFEGNIKIKGFYYAQLGALNETHIINVTYDNGLKLSECDKTIIKGDKITWINNVDFYDSPVEISAPYTLWGNNQIPKGENKSHLFLNPEVFTYYFKLFTTNTNTCVINVLDDTGLINNPEFDDFIYINLNVLYEPTSISTSFLTTSYSMNFDGKIDDIFKITNTGDKIAKSIKLGGEWFSFSSDNFDLNPGESKNIGYTIDPFVSSTEETNKTHIKNITIKGNFNTINQEINIFINHANIGSIQDMYNLTVNEEIIKYLIKKYCEDNPDKDFCKPQVVYANINESENLFNATMSEKELNDLREFTFNKAYEDSEFQNYVKTYLDEQNYSVNTIKIDQTLTSDNIQELVDLIKINNSIYIFSLIIGMFLIAIAIVGYLIFDQLRKNKIQKYETWK